MSQHFSAGNVASFPARVALKVDVNTLQGTELGVPRLTELLTRYGAGATFLFSLGPDHTGRAIKQILQPGFLRKLRRVSVLEHYGLKTLLYGTLLPGPDIGLRCADTLRKVRDSGFETGVHAWDRVKWQDGAAVAGAEWTLLQMQFAIDRYVAIFGAAPRVHGAAAWQMNKHSYRLTQRLGFDFCSDTRGVCPYIPVIDAEIVACPQIPTTLPTFDELLGLGGADASQVAVKILHTSAQSATATGHVFTLRAELEGMKLLPAFEGLLRAWRDAGTELLALGPFLEVAGGGRLPRHRTDYAQIPGRIGRVAVQGSEFLRKHEQACA